MTFIICSDIHGDLLGARAAVSAFERERADKLIILGDLLYHGPRNNLPNNYSPKEVIELLNANRDNIIAVRGNCDAEVDQMVLNFPITSEFAEIFADGKTFVLTHGHRVDLDNPPPLKRGDFLLCGHTHIPKIQKFGNDNTYVNPGSISIPKDNFPRTYMLYKDGEFTLRDIENNQVEI